MMYRTHLLGGVATGIIINKAIGHNLVDMDIFILGASVIGSLLPDIDHKGSYIGRKMRITSSIISSITEHRGATHSPILAFIFTNILFVLGNILLKIFNIGLQIPYIYILSCFFGVLSHIMLDSLTKGGVPLLSPFTKEKISFTNYKTGSPFESIIMIVLGIFIPYLLWGSY